MPTPANPFADLAGRTALVTGASSGLGRHFAEVLTGQGVHVAVAARRKDRLDALADELTGQSGANRSVAVEMDVTDTASVDAAFDAAEAALGPIGIVINNAGVATSRWATKTTDDDWRGVMDVNLDGVFRVARAAANRMRANGTGGSIINIASMLGLAVLPTLTAYATSKAGVIQMTKAMALELGGEPTVRVNALAPGYFATELNADFLASAAGEKLKARVPMRRFGDLADLNGPLLLLASDASRYMTGSVVSVDGGHAMAMG